MTAAQIMADLVRLGIQLEADGDRLRYSPRSVVTPELLQRMKAHKSELLDLLRPDPRPADCRCGGDRYRDVPIHGGRTIRRDCGHCGRFLDFPRCYGIPPGNN